MDGVEDVLLGGFDPYKVLSATGDSTIKWELSLRVLDMGSESSDRVLARARRCGPE